jgi:NDP-sugar pyrophosphorylase family protein
MMWSSCCKELPTSLAVEAWRSIGTAALLSSLKKALQAWLINAGVYLLRKQIVRGLPAGTAISLETEVFPRLLDRRVYGLVCTGLFIDIGIPDDLRRAQSLLAAHPRR